MPNIDSRLAKLELFARDPNEHRTKEERDAAFAAFVAKVRPVAALCNSLDELVAHVKSLEPSADQSVVSLDLRQRHNAVIASFAKSLWDETHGRTGSNNAA